MNIILVYSLVLLAHYAYIIHTIVSTIIKNFLNIIHVKYK